MAQDANSVAKSTEGKSALYVGRGLSSPQEERRSSCQILAEKIGTPFVKARGQFNLQNGPSGATLRIRGTPFESLPHSLFNFREQVYSLQCIRRAVGGLIIPRNLNIPISQSRVQIEVTTRVRASCACSSTERRRSTKCK